MTLSDIAPLFERAKAGDVAALDALSDAAGELVGFRWGIAIDRWAWTGRDSKVLREWQQHRRHAPCVSADCALSVPWPEGYDTTAHLTDMIVVCLCPHVIEPNPLKGMPGAPHFDSIKRHVERFAYTDPAHLPLALTCAALFANLHAKESADAAR